MYGDFCDVYTPMNENKKEWEEIHRRAEDNLKLFDRYNSALDKACKEVGITKKQALNFIDAMVSYYEETKKK